MTAIDSEVSSRSGKRCCHAPLSVVMAGLVCCGLAAVLAVCLGTFFGLAQGVPQSFGETRRSFGDLLFNINFIAPIDPIMVGISALFREGLAHLYSLALISGLLFCQLLAQRSRDVKPEKLSVADCVTSLLVTVAALFLSRFSVTILAASLYIITTLFFLTGSQKSLFGRYLFLPPLVILFVGHFAWAGLAVAVILISAMMPKESNCCTRFRSGVLFLFLCLTVTGYLLTSPPEIPHYPQFTPVVAPSELSGIDPLIGSAPSLQIIDRQALREWLVLPTLALVLSFLIAEMSRVRRGTVIGGSSHRSDTFKVGSVLLVGLVLASSLLPSQIALIGPLYTIERLWPFGVWQPYELLVLPLAGALLLIGHKTVFVILATFLAIVATTLNFESAHVRRLSSAYAAIVDSPDGEDERRIVDLLHSPSVLTVLKLLDAGEGEVDAARHNSLILSRLKDADLRRDLKFERIDEHAVAMSASVNEDQLPFILDSDPESRWANQKGEQQGDEWILFKFNKPVILRGVQLDAGAYVGDYAAEIAVALWSDCEFSDGSSVSDPAWVGVSDPKEMTLLTTDAGYPYSTTPNVLRFIAHHSEPVRCLKISQTGKRLGTDWSVAELRIATQKIRDNRP